MISEFVERWESNKNRLKKKYSEELPESYDQIVKDVIATITLENKFFVPDPERIQCVNYSEYQGAKVYIIGSKGYSPDDYWYVRVEYGSCSGCDTLEAIKDYDEEPTKEKVNDCMTLALHILQSIKEVE